MDIFSHYGFWAALGFILLIAELGTLSFVLFFFGLGALITGLLTYFGILSDPSYQMLCFAVISVISLFALRKSGQRWVKGFISDEGMGEEDSTGLINSQGHALDDFKQGLGRVMVNGTGWPAQMAGWNRDDPGYDLCESDAVLVTGISGNTLIVVPR